jgi:Icc protein
MPRFGLITDVHQDIMHDGEERLRRFIDAMRKARVDFVCQMGDFCTPNPRNRAFRQRWERFEGPRYHVLGNHEIDGGYTWEQAVEFLGMPAPYYGFTNSGVRFLVLNGNDAEKGKGGSRVGDKQQEWLRQEIASTTLPIVVMVHQDLNHPSGLGNRDDVRRLLDDANRRGQSRVIACFSGHQHEDYSRSINGIHYIQVNSASYFWAGEEYKHESYSPDIHKTHDAIGYTCPYREPLWAIVTVDLDRNTLSLEGRRSSWVGPDPWKLKVEEAARAPQDVAPRLSSRVFPLKK